MKKIALLILLGNALLYHTISFSDVVSIKCPEANNAMNASVGSYSSKGETIWPVVFDNYAIATPLGVSQVINLPQKWSPTVIALPMKFEVPFPANWKLKGNELTASGSILTCTFILTDEKGRKETGNNISSTLNVKYRVCNVTKNTAVCHD